MLHRKGLLATIGDEDSRCAVSISRHMERNRSIATSAFLGIYFEFMNWVVLMALA